MSQAQAVNASTAGSAYGTGIDGDVRIVDHKAAVRARVWTELRKVAVPDSRFHYDFSSFIADFKGSHAAVDLLLAHPCAARYCSSNDGDKNDGDDSKDCVFVAPDNCLEYLRERLLRGGTRVLMTTYGIRRGFWLLDPSEMGDPSLLRYAATLDGMERVGRHVSLRDIVRMGLRVGLMITGTGAINDKGVRFGKGHGFFDLEWAMLSSVGVVDTATTTAVAVVHDCQVLEGEELVPEEFDTVCDFVVTPTRVLSAGGKSKPTCGILWNRLEDGMMEDIPPLVELKEMQSGTAKLTSTT